jgi:outer membrane protein
LISACPAFSAEPSPATGQGLGLPEVITMALERNPGLAARREGVSAAERGRQAAWSQNLPKAFVEGGYLASPLNDKLVLPMHQFVPGPEDPNATQTLRSEFSDQVYNFGFRVTLPIFTGGRILAETEIGDLAILLSRSRLDQTRDELVFNVASAFYTILQLEEDVKATEASLKRLEESQRIVKQRRDVGKAADVDVFKINTRVAEVRQALIRVENALEVAHTILARLVGVEPTEKIGVRGPLAYEERAVDLEESLKNAEERRPELLAKRREVDIAGQEVRVALAQRLPQLGFDSNYKWWGTPDGRFGNQDSPAADVDLRVLLQAPLFEEVLRQRHAEARAKLQQTKRELEEVRLRVKQEVKEAALNVAEARARIATAEAALKEAAEALRIEEMKVDVGKSTTEFLLDAQAAQLRSQENYFAAVADYDIQQMALRKAVGQIEVP